eukprot:jgi/Chrzof1/8547/Cz03g15070.t1
MSTRPRANSKLAVGLMVGLVALGMAPVAWLLMSPTSRRGLLAGISVSYMALAIHAGRDDAVLQLTNKHCKERVVTHLYLCLKARATAGPLAHHDTGSTVEVGNTVKPQVVPCTNL